MNGENEIISDLLTNTKLLINLIKNKAANQEQNEIMKKIERDMYLAYLTFDQENSKLYKAWWDVEIRLRRSKRLVDLGAPNIIKQHELQ